MQACVCQDLAQVDSVTVLIMPLMLTCQVPPRLSNRLSAQWQMSKQGQQHQPRSVLPDGADSQWSNFRRAAHFRDCSPWVMLCSVNCCAAIHKFEAPYSFPDATASCYFDAQATFKSQLSLFTEAVYHTLLIHWCGSYVTCLLAKCALAYLK